MANDKKLAISIDIGSDCVKCGFSYGTSAKTIQYDQLKLGKQGSYPAFVLYDEYQGWLFGNDAVKCPKRATYTKIKSLLSFLNPYEMNPAQPSEGNHYKNGNKYFRFFFPETPEVKCRMQDAANWVTFSAKESPKQLCEMFFARLFKDFILPAIKGLEAKVGHSFTEVVYVSVYPPQYSDAYIEEIERLINNTLDNVNMTDSGAFHKIYDYPISSSKAVGLLSYCLSQKTSAGRKDDGALIIVDIGETQASVTKMKFASDGITIDGANSHSKPIHIGGDDYDNLIYGEVERQIELADPMGLKKGDTAVVERPTNDNQFNLKTCIKKGKVYFPNQGRSLPTGDIVFKEGIPFSEAREVTHIVYIKKDYFTTINGDANPSEIIATYVEQELARKNNADVKTLVLSGGAAQTYGLIGAIKRKITNTKVKILEWDSKAYYSNGAAVGGAIWASDVYKAKLKMRTSKSYGSWVMRGGDSNRKFYSPLLKINGEPLDFRGGIVSKTFPLTLASDVYGSDSLSFELFSAVTDEPIEIGDSDTQCRYNAETNARTQLKKLTTDDNRVLFEDIPRIAGNRKRLTLSYKECLIYDREGRATAAVLMDEEGTSEEYKNIKISLKNADKLEIN